MIDFFKQDLQLAADFETVETYILQKLLEFYNTVTYIHNHILSDDPNVNFKQGKTWIKKPV